VKKRPEPQGFSAGWGCTVFRVRLALPVAAGAPAADPGANFQVYESCGGTLRLVSVLPDGTASAASGSAGSPSGAFNRGRSHRVAGAVSEDGERIYWSASSGEKVVGALYLRENASQSQSAVAGGACSEAARACTYPVSGLVGPAAAQFWAASPDGGAALFTVGSLENGEEIGEATLYRYDAETRTVSAPLATQVRGLVGQSEDLSRVYLVSEAGVDGGQPGRANLYLHEAGEGLSFIAELAAYDAKTVTGGNAVNGQTTPVHLEPFLHSARVSPDGLSVAFTSVGQPTGYDNTDAVSGEADQEVYLYRAASGELRCVSCLRSGARPRGREAGEELWAAATIPGWEDITHASNVLSEDGGRLFFESFDPLVLSDTNGRLDVYQWEAVGSGMCTEAAPSHVPVAGGCIDLISSGQSPTDSKLVDASADGSDVFFKTGQSLVAGDPGLVDVYDARVGGGFAPSPDPPSPCQGEGCQGQVPAPALQTPSSFAYQGPGNQVNKPNKPKRCPKGKHRIKRKGKVRCVKNKKQEHRKKASKHRRAGAERGARR
jgi:hypothetical protein